MKKNKLFIALSACLALTLIFGATAFAEGEEDAEGVSTTEPVSEETLSGEGYNEPGFESEETALPEVPTAEETVALEGAAAEETVVSEEPAAETETVVSEEPAAKEDAGTAENEPEEDTNAPGKDAEIEAAASDEKDEETIGEAAEEIKESVKPEASEEDSGDEDTPGDESSDKTEEQVKFGSYDVGGLADGDDSGTDNTTEPDSNAVDTAAVSGITIKNLEAKTEDKTFMFTFCSEENPTEYDLKLYGCYFTDYESYTGGKDVNERLEMVATAIAESFYKNQSFKLSDDANFKERYGLVLHTIDAEKQNIADGGVDDVMCWAASTADMLLFSNWTIENDDGSTCTVDQMYDKFCTNFNNTGSNAYVGIAWYMDGVNLYQKTNADGTIHYGPVEGALAQEKAAKDWHGYYSMYASETVSESILSNNINQLYDAAVSLKENNAVGLAIVPVDSEGKTLGSGHGVTLFGFIQDPLETGMNRIKAILFADSDNDADRYEEESEKMWDKENAVDSVTMYTVSPGIIADDGTEYETYTINDYSSYQYAIFYICTLQNRKSVDVKEDAGTRNSKINVDYFAYELVINNESGDKITSAYAGDFVTITPKITNASYVLPVYSDEPHLMGVVRIYRNGSDTVYETVDFDIRLNDYGWTKTPDLIPLSDLNYKIGYAFREAGYYTFQLEITEIVDKDGNKIDEAYLDNNILKSTDRLNITERPPVPETENKGGDKVHVFTASYDSACGLPLGVRVKRADVGETDLSGLILIRDGKQIDKSMYSITEGGDGSVLFTFGSEYLKKLLPGKQEIIIRTQGGETLFIISISVV